MCVGVLIERDGLRAIHCDSVKELARWFPTIITRDGYNKVDRMADHCLCPVDIQASAAASGYSSKMDDSYMDYVCKKLEG